MQIRLGYDIAFDCPQPTPLLLMLTVHPSRHPDLVVPDRMRTEPELPVAQYRDAFGNICSRLMAPAGRTRVFAEAVIEASGRPEEIDLGLPQVPVEMLPDEALVFLLGSRYCETDLLSDKAWRLFGRGPKGAALVQAICDYAHARIAFGYHNARCTRTATQAHRERRGVCRDYAHLAVTLCRCLNIPARYCTGYLGDIGVPPGGPMDFAAWFEAYLGGPEGGQWVTFDPRNNQPRIGRVLLARGRDAADVAISNSFGPHSLAHFTVVTEEARQTVAAA